MPLRDRPAARVAVLGVVAVLATAAVLGATRGAGGATSAPAGAWRGLVGEPRPEVSIGQRFLVVLDIPSLADHVAAAGGVAGDRQERAWTRQALSAQNLFVQRMAVQGALLQPEFKYARVLNGFSAVLDPRTVALLERAEEVEGVYPVRAAFPATIASRVLEQRSFASGTGSRPDDVGLPGLDGRGVTIALLDTGVDPEQPFLGGRILDGIDVVGGSDGAVPAPKPDGTGELERHGTELAGILAGAGGPAGLAGVAIGSSVLPVRVAGWQRDATGEWAVFGRSDQLIAGLERAVDPNGDGDAHDAARIALVGVAEPYAAFADGPAAHAAAGALRLDTLVVAPSGNDGPAGPGFGSVAGPGGAPAALTVGAADLRAREQRVRLVVHTGLDVLVDATVPLAGAVPPADALSLAVGVPSLLEPSAPAVEQAATLELDDFFDRRGFSRVAGRAALVPGGADTARAVRLAALAGAEAVLVRGASLPAGALGLDERAPVPVAAVSDTVAGRLSQALAAGRSVGVSIAPASSAALPPGRSVAAFSSRGLAFDGRVKPELLASGVAVATSEPGTTAGGEPAYGTVNGSSASAAIVAGAAALLAQARPDLDADGLKQALVGSARSIPGASLTAQGAGVLDLGAAAAAELAARPATLALGRADRPGWRSRRRVTIRNLSSRPLTLRVGVERRGFPAADTRVAVTPRRLRIRPGGTAGVRVEARVPEPAAGGAAAEGAVVLRARGTRTLRIPFAVAFGPRRLALLGGLDLSQRRFVPSDTKPAVLTLRAGLVRTVGGSVEVHPVGRLDLELFTEDDSLIGVVGRLRDVLPGRYAFALTGRDPGGQALDAGVYRLRVSAFPAGAGPPTRRSLRFEIR
ncbi:MAG TPA: S8 family serine peptidase [Gaiellaceae bacterium]|nr:S8 family serine peptidase [Gaiellaceae bacterium]